MGLLYAIFSIFITLFFPKQITDVICYGRHRDRENIKSKKIYCLIYVFWTLFFGLFCLMMGSASGVNNTFDRVLDYYGMKDKLAVGTVTNMYDIVESMNNAGKIVKPC